MAVTPKITFPTSQPGFSTNLTNLTLKGTADPTTKSILVNNSPSGVIYASGAVDWAFVTMLDEGTNIFNVSAKDGAGATSGAATITVTQTADENLNLIVSVPTGITLSRGVNFVTISIIQNPETQVIGYNFYGSQDAGGGLNGFTLLNTPIITEPSYYLENSVVLSKTVDTSGNITATYIVERNSNDYYYSYTHNRNTQILGNKPLSEPNYYVATAVAFDPVLLQEVESPYSSELGASPLLLDTAIADLPARTTLDVQQSYIQEILQTDDTIDVKPGTITRDIHINPPSDEFARLYVIQDFMHRSQSFLTLMALDDANNDGISDPVTTSTYKLKLQAALLIPSGQETQVQQLIDDAFTKLAGNVHITRKAAQQAIGQALFYTRTTPTRDSTISAGGIIETISDETTSPVLFTVLTDFTLYVADLANYYNPSTERYEITLDIQAVNAGVNGNVDADTIQLIVSGIDAVFGVTNPNPTEFGQDDETNAELAARAILAFVSVDAGTQGGYLATALGTPLVQRAKIISAGEKLMQRDIDPLRLVHINGKVDIYIQGELETTYTDTFGFLYSKVTNEPVLIESVLFYQFETLNTEITIDQPIYDVIEIKNVTKSANYDLTGFKVSGDGNVIDIDETLAINRAIGLAPTDIILMSYRFRKATAYVFLHQPVDLIVSIIGENSGVLTSANYELQKVQDPLAYGNSTSATDQMSLIYANGIPVGGVTQVNNELHVLIAQDPVQLNFYGSDNSTIQVTDTTQAITYVRDIDYTVIPGSMNILTQIERTLNSSIPSGASILVNYEAGENFTVSYNANSLLQNVQTRVNTMKHLTADVLVKGAQKTFIDFNLTIFLTQGSDQTSTDVKVRTAVAKLLASKLIGEPVYQSDIVKVIEGVVGVDYIILPFAKMVRANGSIVIREVLNTQWTIYQTSFVTSYKSVQTLSWATTENGGPETAFRGVFENDIQLEMVATAAEVAVGKGRWYISADGHVYISSMFGDITASTVTVTYIVEKATGSRDIDFCEIEYGAVGTMVITYAYGPSFTGF